MGFIIGLIVVFFCVLGGYAIPGGHLKILFQPYEFLIIFGTAIGAFIIANPKFILKDTIKKLKLLFKRTPYNKDSYIALLSFLYVSFKSIKVKGIVEFEPHIEDPQNSKLFEPYSSITANHKVTNFFCDAMRLICIGVDNYHYIEEMMEKEIDLYHETEGATSNAISDMADGLPALGIVAAVLGVIHTMGSITEPPEILGQLIGAALVGTFIGVMISYGVISPIASCLKKYNDAEVNYLEIIKIALLSNMQGNSPVISIETARKNIPLHMRPSFTEMEEKLSNL